MLVPPLRIASEILVIIEAQGNHQNQNSKVNNCSHLDIFIHAIHASLKEYSGKFQAIFAIKCNAQPDF